MWTKNIGDKDARVREVVGVVLIVAGVIALAWGGRWIGLWGFVAGLALGVLMLVTARTRVCPAYLPFKFSTTKDKTQHH